MAAPRKIPETKLQRLLDIAIARRRLRALPTDDELAAECGCTPRGIRDAMTRLLLSVTTVSGEIVSGNIGCHESSINLQVPRVRRGSGGRSEDC